MNVQREPRGVRKVSIKNESGEVIPAYAAIQVTGTTLLNGVNVFTVTKWDGGDSADVIWFNSETDVAIGATGAAFIPMVPHWVLYDDANEPAFQEEWGVEENTFKLHKDGSGFIIMGAANGTRVLAVKQGGGCEDRNEIWKFVIGGSPTAGSFTFDLNVLGVTEEMEFQFDDTDSDVQTELETHTNLALGDVIVTGGPFPNTDITIEFTGSLAKHLMDPPTTIDFSGLTGGTGMVVIFVAVRAGHPQDGSVAP